MFILLQFGETKMRRVILGLTTALIILPTPAFANGNDDLSLLVKDYWADVLKTYPVYASSLGQNDYADAVSDYSLTEQDRRANTAAVFLKRLQSIDQTQLNRANKVEYLIVERTLKEAIEANSYGQRTINFTSSNSWHQEFAGMANNLPFDNAKDFQSYNNRLKQYNRVNDQNIAVANSAIKGGYTLPCISLNGFEKTISGLKSEDVKASRYFEPYTRVRPNTISPEAFETLKAEAASIIEKTIYPEIDKQLTWYTTKYKPACAKAPGISQQPGGGAYYAYRIRNQTTTNLSADDIHKIGLSEVARIRSEMEGVTKQAGYPTREAFIQHLRTDPQYYAKTPDELMDKVARVTKTIDGKMPGLFNTLPRLPYGIKQIPAEIAEGTTTAYYNPGSPDIGIAGNYYVNTSKLDQRPFWEIPALSAHEGVPGHHHQIALQQELPLSDFRKYGVSFTAFVEGWGLYSERLGIEMGLYDTPAKDMGRLSYEMWRACRLVVDTGIHSKGWSKAQAIQFMKDNSALTNANIEAEVNRYISWPGQALAYKLGELKIRELREYAGQQLGQKFELAEFHDIVLGQGPVPLDVLETQVKEWVAETKTKK
jgi:uncharacterized protein (DUF885 family)